jgi:hypothetical protein
MSARVRGPALAPRAPRWGLAIALSAAGIAGVGCDDTSLFVQDEPDAGFLDAAAPDAEPLPDAEAPDVGFADAPTYPDAFVEPAREPVYVHTGDTLFSFDPRTRQIVPVAQFRDRSGPITNMVDIAIDRSGVLFGGTLDQRIFTIDPTSGACRFLFEVNDRPNGLAVLPDGRLVVAGDRVSIVEPRNGQVIEVLVDRGREVTSGDLVGLPDGMLYWTVRGAAGEGDVLVRLDPRTRRTTRLGATGTTKLFGVGYADGVLYGFSADGDTVELDPQSGAVVRRGMLDGRWYGATTNPVLWP